MKGTFLAALIAVPGLSAAAQEIVFDFDNAPLYAPLPLSLTVGGVTAQFTATGQGYSIQSASTAPVDPVGFTGRFVYPSSIFASDLLISFSATLSGFSIQYAPQELACDSSATMRVTAFLDAAVVGTATTNAQAGTWPVETLAFSSTLPFNRVVVHYDKPPVTGGDYGTIFIADNMKILPTPQPMILDPPVRLSNGSFQFTFSFAPAAATTVLTATNSAAVPAAWVPLGPATEVAPGLYQFTDDSAPSRSPGFYRVRTP
jgi:hypothetical protein